MSRFTDGKTPKRPSRVRKYRPAIGRDFGNEQATAQESYETARTRNHLALGSSAVISAALLAAGLHGLYTGSFNYLLSVWAATGSIVGAIAGYYFGRGGKDSG